MKTTIWLLSARTKRVTAAALAAILATLLVMAVLPIITAQATPTAPSPTAPEYYLSVSNGVTPTEDNQHVIVRIDYGEDVNLTAASGFLDNATITIAGNDITSAGYYRPATVAVDPNDNDVLVIDIAGVVDPSTTPPTPEYTYDLTGLVALKGNLTHVTIGDPSKPDVTDPVLNYISVAPVGLSYSEDREGYTDYAEITITSRAQVRGFIHVGLYAATSDDPTYPLVPIYNGTDASPIQARTYMVDINDFIGMDETAIAKAIVSAVQMDSHFGTGYTIANNGPTIKLTNNGGGGNLYIYLFDDSLVKREAPATYSDISAAGGVLPNRPQ